MTKRLPAKDEHGWPYCQRCRKNGVLVPARADVLHPDQPGYDDCCADHHQRWTDDMRLTWEEFCAGEPCRGCGEPLLDATPLSGTDKGTLHDTDEERAVADAEEARYKAKHSDCHAVRHRIHGSLTTHCGRCCPPPPLSPEKWREIAGLLFRMSEDRATRGAASPPLSAPPKPPTRRQLEQRVAELEAEVARLTGASAAK